jgi:hypothetical protein
MKEEGMIYDKRSEHRVKHRNLVFDLPPSIIGLIFEYDDTHRVTYNYLIQEIKMFPIWNITYLSDELDTTSHAVYYCKKIASDMLSHWTNHYTSFVDSLLNYQNDTAYYDRTFVNYLDDHSHGSIIPGRNETIFQWITYYNTIISK